MKISLACDHGGLQLKNHVKTLLEGWGHQVMDFGTNTTDSCDYPDFCKLASKAVSVGECQMGVVVCTTGIGMSIVANKFSGVRCALCSNVDMAIMTRKHNNANMLALGQRYLDNQQAEQILQAFLTTQFEGGRHQTRVDKIETN